MGTGDGQGAHVPRPTAEGARATDPSGATALEAGGPNAIAVTLGLLGDKLCVLLRDE